MPVQIAAYAFTLLTLPVAVFQIALALGAPWGSLTWGGRFPGQLPANMRLVALVSLVLLLAFAVIVLVRAGVLLPAWQPAARWLVWGVVAYSALGVVANAATPSRSERLLWLPVALGLLISSVIVALN